MAALSDHLERLRAKPHHERRQIALLSSVAFTALVAIGWLGALASSPRLALKAESGQAGLSETLTQTQPNFSELMGAAGAAFGASTSPAAVTVVDTRTSSTFDMQHRANHNDTRETVIPF